MLSSPLQLRTYPPAASLFTHEDTFSAHKILGFSCLLHILVRFSLIAVATSPKDLMGFGFARPETPLLIALHSLLSLTSFIFHLPPKRIKEGTRIWPEFRLHSIVFTHRVLLNMLIVWLDEAYPAPDGPRYWLNVVNVFICLAGADLATWSVPPETRSRTITGMEASAAKKAFFTLMQFFGTTRQLLGLRSYDGYFSGVFLIQIAAFTFTLRRKNLISHQVTVAYYLAQLVILLTFSTVEAVAWAGVEGLCMIVAFAAAAMMLRIPAGQSKYVVWAVVAVALQYGRATTAIAAPGARIALPAWAWPVGCAASIGLLVLTMSLHNAKKDRAAAAATAAAAENPPKQGGADADESEEKAPTHLD